MKKLYKLFLLCGIITFTNSIIGQQQQNPDWLWAKNGSCTNWDHAKSVATDAYGNVYAGGRFEISSLTLGSTTLTNAGSNDMFLVKYDSDGNVLWAVRAGGSNWDEATSVFVDASNNIYVAGWFRSTSITFGSTTLTNNGGDDVYLVKYNASGTVIWATGAGGISNDYGNSVAADTSGNIYLTGGFESASLTFGGTTLTNAGGGNYDMYVVKYSSAGNAIWAKSSGGTNDDEGKTVTKDAAGNIYLAGYFSSNNIIFDADTLNIITPVGPNAGGENIFLAKFDGNGNALWAKSAGGTLGGDFASSVALDASNNIYLTGHFSSSPITFGATSLTNSGSSDIFLVKFNNSGNVLWGKRAGGSGQDIANSVFTDASGNSYTGGYFYSTSITFGTDTLMNSGGSDVFIVKHDSIGNMVWTKKAGGISDDLLQSATADGSGNIFAAGMFQSASIAFGSTTLSNTGSYDMFVAKFGIPLPPSYPYCLPTYSQLCSSQDFINNFSFNTLVKNNSGCNGNPNNYINDTTVATTTELGGSYSISMQAGSSYGQGFGVWIDYNQDMDFDDVNEFVYSSPTFGSNVFSGTVLIPDSATVGQTRLRVRCKYNAIPLAGESCGLFDYGEAEDYTLTLVQPPPCTEPPTVGTLSSSKSVVCDTNTQFTLSRSGGSSGWGQYYQGQNSADNITWNTMPGNVIFPASLTQNASTYYRTIAHCGASADTSNSVFVKLNPTLNSILSPTSVLCFGDSNGTITANVSGGTSPFAYLWNTPNAQTSATATGLFPYTFYTVTVTDSLGCVAIGSTQVSEPLQLSVSPYSNNSNCGVANGIAWVQANNGTPPYSYNWQGGSTNDSLIGVAAGSYSVTVTDVNGCTKTAAASVNDTGAPIVPTIITNVSCYGLGNGSIATFPEGGVTPYTYLWSNSQTASAATGLSIGNYFVTVTDAAGCKGVASATVTQPDTLTVQVTKYDAQCFGQATGSAYALDIGGSKPVTFLWSNDSVTANIYSLLPGTYSVTITDNKGCTASGSASVSQPAAPLVPAITTKNATCYGLCNGTMIGGANGGTPPYSYLIPQFEIASPDSIKNICAGTYQVQVNDANSCMVSDSIFITQPTAIVVNAGNDTTLCPGIGSLLNGSATGGVPPYTYQWSPSTGLSNANVPNPTANPGSSISYALIVTDSNNCTKTDSVNFSVYSAPSVSPVSIMNVSCNGGNNGQIYTSVTGGASPYTYLWSNSATVPNINTLISGSYSVTVTDTIGCTGNIAVNITEPAVLIANGGTNQSTCAGYPVMIGGSPSATGGTTPYAYNWTPTTGLSDSSVANPNASPSVTTNYTVSVSDNNGCTNSDSVLITVTAPAAEVCDGIDNDCDGQTDEGITLVSNAGPDQSLCNANATTLSANTPTDGTGIWSVISGNATIANSSNPSSAVTGLTLGTTTLRWTVSGGSCPAATDDVVISVYSSSPTVNAGMDASICEGNTYQLSGIFGGDATSATWTTGGTGTFDNPTLLSAVYTPSAADIATGNVMLTLTTNDPAGPCPAVSDNMIITINPSPTVSVNSTNVSCNGGNNGTATSTPSGGTAPYSFLWSNSSTTQNISSLSAGSYSVTVTDVNGCIGNGNISVTQPSSFVVNIGSQAETCNGDSSGYADVSVTGGTSPYSYLWSTSATNDSIFNLTAGTYSVAITDINSCTASGNATITTLSNLSVSVTNTNVSCNGGNNGTATASVSGGPSPYTYLWSSGLTDSTATGLMAGTHNVTVTDGYGCTSTGNITVTEPAVLSAIATSTNASCNGANNGLASVTVSGGTTAYSYNWSNGATTFNILDLSPGTYTVTVTDGNGCLVVNSAVITEPAQISLTPSSTNVSCNGLCDGSAATSVTGGTSPYTYSWSPGGMTTSSISNLCAGNYNLTVTDANNCSAIAANVSVTQPPAVSASASSSNSTCNGATDGSATAVASGGTAPYSYSWNNGQNTVTATGLAAGNYSGIVTDANGCSDTATVTVTEPLPVSVSITPSGPTTFCQGDSVILSATAAFSSYLWSNSASTENITVNSTANYTVTVSDAAGCTGTSSTVSVTMNVNPSVTFSQNNPTCNGSCNGSVTSFASGMSPFIYSWSNGANGSGISALCAGTYSLTLTDVNGCTVSDSSALTQPPALTSSISSVVNVSCNGTSTGSVTIAANGGTGTLTYSWSNGQTGNTSTGLSAGTYTVTVTDANSCTTTANATITQPGAMTATTTATAASCNGASTGSATVAASGGTSPYSYLWSNAAATDSLNNLAAGSYDVTVTDANGCTANANAIVTEPSALSATATAAAANCNGASTGSATVAASGGTSPYSYLWSNTATTDSLNNLAAGSYNVTVTDANGCTTTANAIVSEPSALTATATATAATCNGASTGSATVVASGGTSPYSYLWSNSTSADSLNNLAAGSYDVSVTDANGCTAMANAVVTQPSAVSLSTSSTTATCGNSDGSASVTASGGTTSYSYLWSNGATTSTISSVSSGAYSVTVTDTNNCSANDVATVNDLSGPSVSITGTVDANCGGPDGSATTSVSGGTSPYIYAWSNGSGGNNLDTVPPGIYSVTVTDFNLCNGIASVTIANTGNNPPTVSGNVTIATNGFTVTSGEVRAFRVSSTPGMYDLVSTTTINTNGDFIFTTLLPIGNYLLQAIADTLFFPTSIPTYFGLTHHWDSASVLNINCDTALIVDLEVISLPPMGGTSDFKGKVIAIGGNKWGVSVGDPVPGVDISLEQIPGGIVARDVTDSTGDYGFLNVPQGKYEIFVDIPGLGMDTTYTLDLTTDDTTVTDLNFFVGDTSIFIEEAVSVAEIKTFDNTEIRIYPNPFNSSTNFEYVLKEKNDVLIEVYNLLGEKIFNVSKKSQLAGKYMERFNAEKFDATGIYFVKFTIGGQIYSHKIIQTN